MNKISAQGNGLNLISEENELAVTYISYTCVGHKPENQEYKAVLRCDNRAS
jgi:hypothetical protein